MINELSNACIFVCIRIYDYMICIYDFVLFSHKSSGKIIDKYHITNFIIILLQQIITNYYVESID